MTKPTTTTQQKQDTRGIISIHGKDYMTVARRVELAHDAELEAFSITTEVLFTEPNVVIKATVTTKKGIFTGISSANPTKTIEKQNPFEVAETSAVGRALGFAGYGIVESIASADEMHKATQPTPRPEPTREPAETTEQQESTPEPVACEVCGAAATEKKGITKAGRKYHGIFCSTEDRSHTRWLWNN